MFVYTFSYMFINLTEYDFFIQRACLQNLNYNKTICDNLYQFETEQKNVQIEIANFLKYKNILDKFLPIFMSYYYADHSDGINRIFLIVIGFTGKCCFSFVMWIVIMIDEAHLNYSYLSTIPLILTGGDILITSSIYSVLKDTTKPKKLKFKVSVLQASYFAAMPFGSYIGKYLLYTVLKKHENKYCMMYLAYTSILVVCFVYTFLLYVYKTESNKYLDEEVKKSLEENKSSSEEFKNSNEETTKSKTLKNTLLDPFNIYKGFKNIDNIVIKLLFIATMLYSFQKDEKAYLYLYSKKNFKWTGSEFSDFKIVQYILMFITMVIGLPLLNKYYKINESVVIFISTISGILGKLLYYFSFEFYFLYIGLLVGCLNPCTTCMIKSLISRLSTKNVSVIFVLLNSFDILVMSFSNIVYSYIYEITIDYRFSGIFLLSALSQFLLLLLNIPIYKKTKIN